MKSKKLIQFKNDFDAIDKMRIFEIEVINRATQEQDFIIFDIEVEGTKLIAQHVALTKKQENSKKIAFVSVRIDPDFSMDQNLEELYSACIDAILGSDFYELSEN